MKRLRLIYPILVLLLCPIKGVAQGVEQLSDSLVYSIAMYRESYNEYKINKSAFQNKLFQLVKEVSLTTSRVGINTKLEEIGIDAFTIFDLIDAANKEYGVSISEEQAMGFVTVGDVYQAVRPRGDSIPLSLVYYPWRMAFESRQVHRVSIYDDGISILTDMIELSADSIQREIYLNELMNVYDVWCEYVDTINTRIDHPYSRTLILSEKARKYVDECMPLVYGVHRDSINKSNIMESYAVKAYNLLRDALYEQEHKEDLHYTIPLYYFPLTQASIAYHHGNKNTKAFEKQYHADFDTVDIRLSDLMAMESIDEGFRRAKIRDNYDNIKKSYNETCDMMDLGSATNWRELEPIYRNQLAEKRELWDFGIEDPDADFLDRIIRSLRNDSSDVRLEALECYVEYIVPTPAKGENYSADKAEEYIAKRNLLYRAYANNLRGRYKDCITVAEDILKVEKEKVGKAYWYYQIGKMYILLSSQATSAKEKDNNTQYAALRFKLAVRENPNYAAALYRLASAYSQIRYSSNSEEEPLKAYLCNKYATRALENLKENATNPDFARFHDKNVKEEDIKKLLSWCKTTIPDCKNILFSMGYLNGGEYKFKNEGVWKGESVIIPSIQ